MIKNYILYAMVFALLVYASQLSLVFKVKPIQKPFIIVSKDIGAGSCRYEYIDSYGNIHDTEEGCDVYYLGDTIN